MTDTPKPATPPEPQPQPRNRAKLLWVLVLLGLAVLFFPNRVSHSTKSRFELEREAFWGHWGDKKAEVLMYQLSQPWKGENRLGYAVMLTNIQDMALSVPGPKDAPAPIPQTVSTMAFKMFKRIRAGITDASYELATFVPISEWNVGPQSLPRLVPARTSLNTQTWIGSGFEQLQPTPEGLQYSQLSTDAVGQQQEIFPYRGNMIGEDALFVAVRELVQPLTPGNYAIFSGLLQSRMNGEKPGWVTAVVTKGSDIILKDSPLGSFSTTKVTVQVVTIQSSRTYQFLVERDYPRRIIAWEVNTKLADSKETTETAELVGALRADYWNELGKDFERSREILHLP